jgi:hypothetical protein
MTKSVVRHCASPPGPPPDSLRAGLRDALAGVELLLGGRGRGGCGCAAVGLLGGGVGGARGGLLGLLGLLGGELGAALLLVLAELLAARLGGGVDLGRRGGRRGGGVGHCATTREGRVEGNSGAVEDEWWCRAGRARGGECGGASERGRRAGTKRAQPHAGGRGRGERGVAARGEVARGERGCGNEAGRQTFSFQSAQPLVFTAPITSLGAFPASLACDCAVARGRATSLRLSGSVSVLRRLPASPLHPPSTHHHHTAAAK